MSLPDSAPSTPPTDIEKSESPILITDVLPFRPASSRMSLFDVKPPTQKRQPRSFGPLLKAYAFALRPKITSSTDMSADDRAFFTSTSMHKGVPLKMHDAYTNSRVFALSDAIQNDRSPVFSQGGRSFIRFLESYLDHVEDSSRTDEDKLKLVEEKYRAIKREASLQLELAEFKWQHALERDPQMTFDNWIEKYGYDYKDACEERAIAKETLRRAQQTGSRDVLRQKDLMNSSLNSQIEVPGSNMPCALKDVGNATTEVMGDPPKDIAYQPLHVLPGFKFAAEAWAAKGLQDKHDLTELPINLLAGFTGSWHDLGFDSGKVLDKVFQRGSQKYKKIENTIQGWKMTLRYTEMRSFEVNRGLWNIPDFRTILPELARTAPEILKNKIYQTTRILMVYNADLVLELPPALFAKLFPHAHQEKPGSRAKPTTSTLEGLEDELLTELFHTFPFAKLPKREWDHENEMHVRGEFNDLYPACLGVLTSKV